MLLCACYYHSELESLIKGWFTVKEFKKNNEVRVYGENKLKGQSLNYTSMINNSEFILNQKGIFYKLKEESLVQSVLLNTLLTKYNCYPEDLAIMLQTNAAKIERVLLGQEQLSEKESSDLVGFFYIASKH